jgi:hypothetical protein
VSSECLRSREEDLALRAIPHSAKVERLSGRFDKDDIVRLDDVHGRV